MRRNQISNFINNQKSDVLSAKIQKSQQLDKKKIYKKHTIKITKQKKILNI